MTDPDQEGFGQFWWTQGRNAGEKYIGQFLAEKREGRGSYFFRNGDVFTGVCFRFCVVPVPPS